MKNSRCGIAAILIWFASATFAQAFYNPNSGRWLSRDPIEENGGINLVGFVSNCALSQIDELGLDFYLNEEALGPRPPIPLPDGGFQSGLTVTTWNVDAPLAPCEQPEGRNYMVIGNGTLNSRYWWSSPSSLFHETVHVLKWGSAWNSFTVEAQKHLNQCVCLPKARCLQGLVYKLSRMHHEMGHAENAQFDCDSYGERCVEASSAKSNAEKLKKELEEASKQCDAIPN
jgi:uncharacterized protein RhaS with RHS repeats